MLRFPPGLAAIVILLLASCSGGGGGDTSAPQLPSGVPDSTYGPGGHVELAGGPIAVAPDGSAFVNAGLSLVKLDPAGQRVTSFGAAAPQFLEGAYRPVLHPDGNVSFLRTNAVGKVDADGRAVAAFGMGGLAQLDDTGPPTSLALGPGGELYALVSTSTSSGHFAASVVKLDPNGQRVPAYGGSADGIARAAEGLQKGAVLVDTTGAAYVAGALDAASLSPAVVKLRPDGTRDTQFGDGGMWTDSGCRLQDSLVSALAFAPEGGLIIGANCDTGAWIFKLDASGRTVDSFRERGHRVGLFGSNLSLVHSLVVGLAGDIYAVGRVNVMQSCTDMAVAKLDRSGEPVTSFGADGVVWINHGGSESFGSAALDGFGRLYVTGSAFSPCTVTRPMSAFSVVYRFGP